MKKDPPIHERMVKVRIKKIFAEFGCSNPYMPSAAIYGRRGGADFIECMFGHYIAVEAKRRGAQLTTLQQDFGMGVQSRGGTYLVVDEENLDQLRYTLACWQRGINAN